ncbi:hypothetical protein TNCT_209311 [Trichonephila clavata]|uniref:Uncharacterized protein n=1 Tax=Trichonephila clavata TaxID=2740835 RepID=A0A8X6KMX1_TRICU|nr:hypothetical protein TNCT_209311 [Trichonephila clavata]
MSICWYRATASKQLMGDLPGHRVTPSRPFSVCGADYAGPINVLRYRELDDIHVSKILQEDNFCITDMDMEWFRLWNIYKSLTQNNSTFEVVKV